MKARIGNVEFEASNLLRLLSKFTEDKKLFEKIEKIQETEKAVKIYKIGELVRKKPYLKQLSRDNRIAQAVKLLEGHYGKRKPKLVIFDSLPNIKGRRKSKWWTKKEKAFLDKARHDLPVGRIAKLLKRSSAAVRCQIWILQHSEMPNK
jgi:hypothetical protein